MMTESKAAAKPKTTRKRAPRKKAAAKPAAKEPTYEYVSKRFLSHSDGVHYAPGDVLPAEFGAAMAAKDAAVRREVTQ